MHWGEVTDCAGWNTTIDVACMRQHEDIQSYTVGLLS